MQALVIYYSIYVNFLMVWRDDCNRARPSLRGHDGQRFYRMWEYYLHACAARFRSRRTRFRQIVLTRRGKCPGYPSIRPWTANMTGADA